MELEPLPDVSWKSFQEEYVSGVKTLFARQGYEDDDKAGGGFFVLQRYNYWTTLFNHRYRLVCRIQGSIFVVAASPSRKSLATLQKHLVETLEPQLRSARSESYAIAMARERCLALERASKGGDKSAVAATLTDWTEIDNAAPTAADVQAQADLDALPASSLKELERLSQLIAQESLAAVDSRERSLRHEKPFDRLVGFFTRNRRTEILRAMSANDLLTYWRTQDLATPDATLQQLILETVGKEATQASKEGHYPLWLYKLELRKLVSNDDWFVRNVLPTVDSLLAQLALQYLEQETDLCELWDFRQSVRFQGDDTDKLIVPTVFCCAVALITAPQTPLPMLRRFADLVQQDGDVRDKAFFEPLLQPRLALPTQPPPADPAATPANAANAATNQDVPQVPSSGTAAPAPPPPPPLRAPAPPPPPPIEIRVELQELAANDVATELAAVQAQKVPLLCTANVEIPANTNPKFIRAHKVVSRSRNLPLHGVLVLRKLSCDHGNVPVDKWDICVAALPAALLAATRRAVCDSLDRFTADLMRRHNWPAVTLQCAFHPDRFAPPLDAQHLRVLSSPPFSQHADGSIVYTHKLTNASRQDGFMKGLNDLIFLRGLASEDRSHCAQCSKPVLQVHNFVVEGGKVWHRECVAGKK